MSEAFKGIFKLIEECGEVIQVAGKLGPFPQGDHPDGAGPLKERLEDELADLTAASRYVIETNGLDAVRMEARARAKLKRFQDWGLTGINSEVKQA